MRIGVIMYQTSLTKGQELVAQRMVKEFRRQGHEAYLVTSIYHDQEPVVTIEEVLRRGGYVFSFDEKLGIPVLRVNSQGGNWPPRRIAFVDFMANLTRIVDDLKLNVLITHSTLWNGPEEVAKFVEWRRKQSRGGSPVEPIVFCHMSHYQEPSDERYDLEERTFRETWNSASLPTITKAADYVLLTTPYEKEPMKKLGVDESKFVLFPGGIDSVALDFSSGASDFRAKYSIPKGPKLVTFLGTVEERKNVAALVRVANLLKGRNDVHFVVAGRLESEYAGQVRESASGLPNFTLLGPVPDEDIPSMIRETYANILMSRSEALGLTQLEFMYSGVPVVTSGVGGQAWLVTDRLNGYVLQGPDDVGGAAATIQRLADDEALRDRLGQRAKDVASRHTMPKLIHSLAKAISLKIIALSSGEARSLESGERVIEAWAEGGYKVAATSRRLLVSYSRSRDTIAIPYGEISDVTKGVRLQWWVMGTGGLVTVGLWMASTVGMPWSSAIVSLLTPLGGSGFQELGPVTSYSFALVPVILAAIVFAVTRKVGFNISFAGSKKIFLPKRFLGAIQIADEMTPQSLFKRDPLDSGMAN